jgi:hypothetical protein
MPVMRCFFSHGHNETKTRPPARHSGFPDYYLWMPGRASRAHRTRTPAPKVKHSWTWDESGNTCDMFSSSAHVTAAAKCDGDGWRCKPKKTQTNSPPAGLQFYMLRWCMEQLSLHWHKPLSTCIIFKLQTSSSNHVFKYNGLIEESASPGRTEGSSRKFPWWGWFGA